MTFSTWNPLSVHDAFLIAMRDTIWPAVWPMLVILYCVVFFACVVGICGGDWWDG